MSYGKIDIQSMIDEADLDGDGKIDYQEFLTLLREKTRTIFVMNKWSWIRQVSSINPYQKWWFLSRLIDDFKLWLILIEK